MALRLPQCPHVPWTDRLTDRHSDLCRCPQIFDGVGSTPYPSCAIVSHGPGVPGYFARPGRVIYWDTLNGSCSIAGRLGG
jgi:hypothetical protein